MKNTGHKSLNLRVRALRKIAKLSQEEVADKIGMSIYNYKNFEEDGKEIDQELIFKLSELFDQSLITADSEIIISSQNHHLVGISVKKEKKNLISEFVQEFIKLNTNQKDLFIKIIHELKNV
jgi:transcriptional regulator with XRE-family HTH domain